VNDNRQKRLSEALRANLKRRKQQLRGRAGQVEQEPAAREAPEPAPEEDTGQTTVRNEDKRR